MLVKLHLVFPGDGCSAEVCTQPGCVARGPQKIQKVCLELSEASYCESASGDYWECWALWETSRTLEYSAHQSHPE